MQLIGGDVPDVATFRRGEEYVFTGTLARWANDSGMPFAYVNYTQHAPKGQ